MVQYRRYSLKAKPILLSYSTSRKETFCLEWWGLEEVIVEGEGGNVKIC